MNDATLPIPEGRVECPKCRGVGIIFSSQHLGGGVYNDTSDTCGRCNATGHVEAPTYHGLTQASYDQLRNHLTHGYWLAVTAWLEHQNSTTEAALTAAIKALAALGLDEREYRRKADALLEERPSTWAQSAESLSALELESLR